jgi:hypothetical protein
MREVGYHVRDEHFKLGRGEGENVPYVEGKRVTLTYC